MRKDNDPFLEYLREIGNIVGQFHLHNVPKEHLDSFQRACVSSAPIDEKERAQMLTPLAGYLFERLVDQKGQDGAAVRDKGKMPPSIIANATMLMIDVINGRLDYLPKLKDILDRLLDIKSYKNSESRRPEERDAALMLFALKPDLRINWVAKCVGVPRSTVSRWQNSDDFKRRLAETVEFCADPVGRRIIGDALMYSMFTDEDFEAEFGSQ